MTLSQYKIEKVNDSAAVAYRLHGSRGGVIRLVRNQSNPELLYAINKTGQTAYIGGSAWFTDHDGNLKAAHVREGR